MDIYYALQVGEQYRCGACSFLTTDVKSLHFHVRQHTVCGSYFFCNDTKTAFPRNRKLPATTQTELLVEITSDDIIRTGNSLRFIPEVETKRSSPSKTPKKPVKKKAHASDVILYQNDDYTDDFEPMDDFGDLETAALTATPSTPHTTTTSTPRVNSGSNPLVEIPLSYKSMSNEELLDILLNEMPDESIKKQEGKNYIVVQGGKERLPAFDDGVRWNSFSRNSSKQVFMIDSDMKLSRIYKKGTRYCTMRLEKKKKKFEVMQPQPTTVFAFLKVFISLEGNNSYRRRITCVAEAPDDLAHLMDKSIVEYYMDIVNVRKESTTTDPQVSVTLPDCSKLKQMLYPGISKEIPEYVKEDVNSIETNVEKSKQVPSGQARPSIDGNIDVNEDGSEFGGEQDEADTSEVTKQSKVTAFQFMSSEEVLKILTTEDESNDLNKNYTVYKSDKTTFSRLDIYGVWDVSNTNRTIEFVQAENREFKQVTKRRGKYCVTDKAAGNEYVELTPQPRKEDLLVLQRCTFNFSNSKGIRKRETLVLHVPNNGFVGLKNKHIIEYISERMALPIHVEKENGRKTMIVQHHKLLPCGIEFQEKLNRSIKSGVFPHPRFQSENNYFTNEEILEKLIVEDINTKPREDSGRNYMVIQNEKADGKKKSYLKDGCSWSAKDGTSTNQTFIINEHNQLRGVMKRDGKWCVKRIEKKRRIYAPLEPQPAPNELITIHKYFTSLKSCSFYKKRITSVTLAPPRLAYLKYKILVEYYTEHSKIESLRGLKKLCFQENRKDPAKSDAVNEAGNTSLKRKLDDSMEGAVDQVEDGTQDELNDSTENSEKDRTKSIDSVVESVSVELPVSDMFRTSQECWEIFTSNTPVQSVMQDTHTKDYILVQCDESEGGVHSSVYQDGLLWDTSGMANSRSSYLLEDGKIGRSVVRKNGVLCFNKHDRDTYDPVVRQSRDIITFYRTWIKSKGSNSLKKRVTNITEVPTKYALAKSRALIEYCMDESPCEEANKTETGDLVFEMIREIQTGNANEPQPYIKMANMEDNHDLDTDEIESESEDEAPTQNEVAHEKPTYTPQNIGRKFRSPRLQQRSLKKIKLETEDDNYDTPESQSSQERIDTSKAKTSPKKSLATIVSPCYGRFGFPKNSETMNSEEIFNRLLTEDGLHSLKERPAGEKYAIVNVDWNGGDRKRLLKDNFSWDSGCGSTQNSFYAVNPDYTLSYLVQRQGKYHKKKKENNRVAYELLDPQPKEVVKVHRYWVKGKAMPDLAKRVTSITEAPERLKDVKSRVLVEYSWC